MAQKIWTWPRGFVERSLEVIKNRDTLDSEDSTLSLKVVIKTHGKHTKKNEKKGVRFWGNKENDSMSYNKLTLQNGYLPESSHSLLRLPGLEPILTPDPEKQMSPRLKGTPDP